MQNHIACQRTLSDFPFHMGGYLAGIVEDEIRYKVGDIITGVTQKQSRQKAAGE